MKIEYLHKILSEQGFKIKYSGSSSWVLGQLNLLSKEQNKNLECVVFPSSLLSPEEIKDLQMGKPEYLGYIKIK